MAHNYFFTKQKFGVKKRLFLIDKLKNIQGKEHCSVLGKSLSVLSFITSFIRPGYSVLLAFILLQSIAFSSFSKEFSAKNELRLSEKERFEIRNLSVVNKHYSIISKAFDETENLLNDYSKANFCATIDEKVSIIFLGNEGKLSYLNFHFLAI